MVSQGQKPRHGLAGSSGPGEKQGVSKATVPAEAPRAKLGLPFPAPSAASRVLCSSGPLPLASEPAGWHLGLWPHLSLLWSTLSLRLSNEDTRGYTGGGAGEHPDLSG